MPTLHQTHLSNTLLKTTHPNLTAIFIGGTSGIGEATAKALARSIPSPTIYIVGRNQQAGSRILSELRDIQPDGEYSFIGADLTLLKNVERTCEEIKKRRGGRAVDLLFLSTGGLATRRDDTTEGLESNHVLRYYARTLIITSLIPLLSLSTSPHIINILAGGKEIPYTDLDLTNLDLAHSFSFTRAGYYATTMLSLAQEYLSQQYPGISFAHVFPGFVPTPIFKRGFGGLLGGVIDAVVGMLGVGLEESGERCLFIATSGAYPPLEPAEEGSGPLVDGVGTCVAGDGVVGGGAYILGYDGRDVANKEIMKGYREREVAERAWEHTVGVFERVLGGK
ncbi:hypothetical protein BJX70DRAFT_406323 [Aspergillus crustosus]